MRQPYVLQTARLGMRRYTMADAEPLRAVFADPYAAKFYPAMNQQDQLERWIRWNLKNYEDHGFGLWALELLESGLFIGDTGITYQTVEENRILEVRWHIHPDFRDRRQFCQTSLQMNVGRPCIAQRLAQFLSHLKSQCVDQKQHRRSLAVTNHGAMNYIFKEVSLLQLR